MDPVSIVQSLAGAVKYLWQISQKMQENAEECTRLCEHGDKILDIIRGEHIPSLPPKLTSCLHTLSNSFLDISVTGEKLSQRSFLQRLLWRDQISSKIQNAYKDIALAMQEFHFKMSINLARMQHENEVARRADAQGAKKAFDNILHGNQDILTQLQVQNRQMQEAMMSVQRYLINLPASLERDLLKKGLQTMQRRSGRVIAIPDEFLITSLDVIIYYERRLGAGGFAEVFEADWKGSKVAVKVLEKGLPASAIEQEVNVWKRLRHPHILEFFGACPIAESPFMVCALKENGDAIAYLGRHPECNRRELLSQSAQGLEYLHRNGVVHGDLKATNILIDGQGNACLADFGLSRVKNKTATVRQASQNEQLGTMRWMAPEHMIYGTASKETDVYSFGMTMYEIFTECPPFEDTPDSMLFTIVSEKNIRPRRPTWSKALESGLDDAVWDVITDCWRAEPEDRPEVSQLVTSLGRLCAVAELSTPGTGWRLVKKNTTGEQGSLLQTGHSSPPNSLLGSRADPSTSSSYNMRKILKRLGNSLRNSPQTMFNGLHGMLNQVSDGAGAGVKDAMSTKSNESTGGRHQDSTGSSWTQSRGPAGRRNVAVEYHRPSRESIQEYNDLLALADVPATMKEPQSVSSLVQPTVQSPELSRRPKITVKYHQPSRESIQEYHDLLTAAKAQAATSEPQPTEQKPDVSHRSKFQVEYIRPRKESIEEYNALLAKVNASTQRPAAPVANTIDDPTGGYHSFSRDEIQCYNEIISPPNFEDVNY